MTENYRRNARMYSLTTLFVLTVLSFIVTFFDTEHFEATVRYAVASFAFGVTQVRASLPIVESPKINSYSNFPIPDRIEILFLAKPKSVDSERGVLRRYLSQEFVSNQQILCGLLSLRSTVTIHDGAGLHVVRHSLHTFLHGWRIRFVAHQRRITNHSHLHTASACYIAGGHCGAIDSEHRDLGGCRILCITTGYVLYTCVWQCAIGAGHRTHPNGRTYCAVEVEAATFHRRRHFCPEEFYALHSRASQVQ